MSAANRGARDLLESRKGIRPTTGALGANESFRAAFYGFDGAVVDQIVCLRPTDAIAQAKIPDVEKLWLSHFRSFPVGSDRARKSKGASVPLNAL
jgi:hypothetical protein